MDSFIHQLYQKYYANKKPVEHLEVCIRCQRKGKLRTRKPYTGLCRACCKAEYASKN